MNAHCEQLCRFPFVKQQLFLIFHLPFHFAFQNFPTPYHGKKK
jgi:hypothetical protein